MDSAGGPKCYRKIVIGGVVQGVGFRPFVLRLARDLGICGTVRNTGGAVLILACGDIGVMDEFQRELKDKAPSGAAIATMTAVPAEPFCADGFSIVESNSDKDGDNVFISPDIGICDECLRDIEDASGRRFEHPFNSCVDCGPRFSILDILPYDRENTAMAAFPLCESCNEEYLSQSDRRCHAQTVCCNDCGPVLRFQDKKRSSSEGRETLASAIDALRRGEIVAVKGIGGYHFACSPYDGKAVQALRELKGRDKKPFAIMFRDMDAVREVCFADDNEARLLASPARPITLLELKEPAFADEVLCGDIRCGCFLPYTALHRLLLNPLSALILTSANAGGGAIFTDDGEMQDFFEASRCERFAGVLSNNRRILRAVEDSVARIDGGEVCLLRRSRGYAPSAVSLENRTGQDFLAMGGDLKATFCLVKNSHAYQGAYVGDLEEKSVYDRYRSSMRDFASLLGVKPEFVLCDSHPAYLSSALAEEWGLPVIKVQHHHAHIASVMAEHGLHEKVLGVAFDGTGYGDDGHVWGGEFLICEENRYKRAGHLDYTALLGGDSSVRDAQRTAFCFLYGIGADGLKRFDDCNRCDGSNRCDGMAETLEAALKAGVNTVRSSSMGRLFDAASAILGLGTYNSYEGECAVLLQREAERARKAAVKPYPLRFEVTENNGCLLADAKGVVRALASEQKRSDTGALAFGFHVAVAELVRDMCVRLREQEACGAVALSGGVFQNGLLLELTREKLIESGFRVYVNRMTVPNDGGIALGQAYIGGKIVCV